MQFQILSTKNQQTKNFDSDKITSAIQTQKSYAKLASAKAKYNQYMQQAVADVMKQCPIDAQTAQMCIEKSLSQVKKKVSFDVCAKN